jgi:hypothetical protein
LVLEERLERGAILLSSIKNTLSTDSSNEVLTRRERLDRRAMRSALDILPAWDEALPALGFGSVSDLQNEVLSVPTTLSRVNERKAMALIVYGYLATMEALHVS